MKKSINEAIKIAGKVVDNWLPLKIGYDHTPGAVVCIAQNGVIKYVRAFGVSNLESNIPLQSDGQFRVASMSKMFTAVAILKLQEAGKLRLDDKVSEYITWFKGKSKQTDLANVTIRQLLSHNAGIWRDGEAQQWINDKFPVKLEGTVSAKSITFENGTTFKYSNHGYAVLGAVIEKVSNKTYEEYCVEEIIKPLKLNSTFPDLPSDVPKKLVSGHVRWVPGILKRVAEPHIKTNSYAPATGFISSVKDLVVFLASLHIESKKSVLSRESRKAMMQVHGIPSDSEGYGLGLSLDRVSGQLTYGHSGGFAGYVTNAIAEPENNLQVVVLTNTQSNTAWQVSNDIVRLVSKLAGMSNVVYVEKEPYSGVYRSRWGDMTVVSLGKDLVAFSPSADNPGHDWTMLKKEKQHTYSNTKKNGFSDPGETTRFTNLKDGKAYTAVTNGNILERIL